MVSHSNGRTASLLDSAGPGTSRPATESPPVEVGEKEDTFVVRVELCEGPIELRVPIASVKARPKHHRHHIKGFNADATPC